jgi:hypothetical protein
MERGAVNSRRFRDAWQSRFGYRLASDIVKISAIVNEAVGRGLGHQAIVAFKTTEPITVADVLAVIERLCGGPSGWQHLQKKAQIA